MLAFVIGGSWRRDPVVWATAALASALAVPLVVPGLSSSARSAFSDTCTTAPFLLLALGLMWPGRRAAAAGERRFWALCSASVGCWLLQQVINAAAYPSATNLAASLTHDLLYAAMYLFLVLALDARPHLDLTSEARDPLAVLRRTGAVVFVFGLLAYLLLAPVASDPDSYLAGTPSFTLYVVLDAYLILRSLTSLREARARRWRVTYGWLLAAGCAWLVLDAAEGLMFTGVVPDIGSGTPWDLPWFVPPVALVMTARSRSWTATGADASAAVSSAGYGSSTGSPLVILALLVPLLHLSLYNLGLFDRTSTRPAREAVALVWLAVLGGLVFAYQRALEARNRRLDAERRAALALVEHQALHDPLTNVANRRLLWDRLGQAMAEATRRGEKLALVFLDMDEFKELNDAHGHAAGDEALRRIAERLAAQVRSSDTVARVGGDEFVVLLSGVHDRETADRLAAKIERSFDAPFAIAAGEFHLGASVGVSLFPDDATDSQGLTDAADLAMYRAKEARAAGPRAVERQRWRADGDDVRREDSRSPAR